MESKVIVELTKVLKKIVGIEHVSSDAITCGEVSRTTEIQSQICSLVVYPGTAQEIQDIMKVANTFKISVWPFSGGKNWGYGTSNALEDGAIILMLNRLNKIIEVNEELAYAVLEPGVTQQQLYDYLQEKHPTLISDCTDSSPYGSVVGNSIERGYGYTPAGDHFAQLCGLELVLPSGDIFVTGGGSRASRTWPTYKWGYGPSVDGLFSQSNLGVVVKAGVWLMPKPEELNLFILDLSKENLAPALDELRKLALGGTVKSHVHTANAFQTLSLIKKYPEHERKSGLLLSDEVLKQLQAELGIPDWTAIGGLYGAKQQVQVNSKIVAKRLGSFGKINFFNEKKVQQSAKLVDLWKSSGGRGPKAIVAKMIKSLVTKKDFSLVAILPEMYGVLVGKPTWQVLKSAYFKSNLPPPETELDPARDRCGIMWMAPAVPMTANEMTKAETLAQRLFKKYGFNLSACFTMMNQRTLFFLLGIFFDQNNLEEKARAANLYSELHSEFASHGYQHYRGGIPDWKIQIEGELSNKKLLSELKKSVDPNQILAPGRYGI